MSDLPEIIINLWARYLKEQYDVVYDDFWVDEDYGIREGGELDYRVWSWTVDGQTYTLYDINTWPGDNEDGTIYITYQGQMYRIYNNTDTNLYPNTDLEQLPPHLIRSLEDLTRVPLDPSPTNSPDWRFGKRD